MTRYNRVGLARKKELEKPDEFITFSKKMLETALKNKIQLFVGLGLFFGLIIIVSGYKYFSDLAEVKAFTLLQEEMKGYDEINSSKSPGEAYQEVKNGFESIIDKYPRTVAGKLSLINFANICFAAGKYNEAIALYEKAVDKFYDNESFRNLALSSLAHSYEANKNKSEAAKCFEKVVSSQDGVLKDEALFNLGRIYGELGDEKKSTNYYQKLITDYKDSIYFELAKENTAG